MAQKVVQKIHNLGAQNSIFNHYIAEIRDQEIQKDPMRFRRNLERIGEIFAYEISKQLDYAPKEVITPLGLSHVEQLTAQPVVASVLRAGLTLHQGLLSYFDRAENAFISAYRKHQKDGSFEIEVEYLSCPSLEGKTLILADPMLATGSSMVLSYQSLIKFGQPAHTHIVTTIASSEGLDYLCKKMPANITIWTGAIDEELTAQAYIVPGLGDAGDLAYGVKVQE
ncbi:MAG: uracil phosphoribosyltransferase [Salibacteraceae bacterium]